jgi:CDP-6-deoxy-D-xylo-4-hexulose-3-dehydrase
MKTERQLRQGIFKKAREIYKLRKDKERFIPGRSAVNYGGRVYDEKEIINLLDSGLDFWLTAGRYAGEFENKLSQFLDVRYCMLTNSGSSANLLAVSALTSQLLKERRLKPGDEAITTACGFPTTLNPIIQNGLTPVFIDIDIGNYNIQTDAIEKAISRKTKAIIIGHTLGNPAEIQKILRIAKKYHLWFIEDNCEALGSKYKGRYTGTFGDISTCSFYPSHHITMGEGGAVLTDEPLLRRIIMSLRDWGRDCWCKTGYDNTCGKRFSRKFGRMPFGYDHKYVYSHIGYNLKVTDMQAAVGIAQLQKLPQFIEARKKNFSYLYAFLKKYENYFILPQTTRNSQVSWFGFPLTVRQDAPFARADIVNYLENKKIATRMLFGGNLTKQPAYKYTKYRIAGKLQNTDLAMNNTFWLGVYPGLTQERLDYIGAAIQGFLRKRG